MPDLHADHHEVKSVHFEDPQSRLAYLREIYAPHREAPQTFRTPGTFLAEFVFNGLAFDQIVDFLKSDKAQEYCACCMDERVVTKKGGRFITSHKSCGAAGLVHDALRASPELQARMAAVVGQAALDLALNSPNKDKIGQLWSKALAEAVGAEYAHLDVDHGHHYTTMAVMDAGGCFLGDTPGKVGERTFIISNTEFLGNQDKKTAYGLMVQYGFLALNIARGSHSTLAGKDQEYPFTLLVTRDEGFDQDLFDQVVQNFLTESKTDYSSMNYQIEFLDESKLT